MPQRPRRSPSPVATPPTWGLRLPAYTCVKTCMHDHTAVRLLSGCRHPPGIVTQGQRAAATVVLCYGPLGSPTQSACVTLALRQRRLTAPMLGLEPPPSGTIASPGPRYSTRAHDPSRLLPHGQAVHVWLHRSRYTAGILLQEGAPRAFPRTNTRPRPRGAWDL